MGTASVILAETFCWPINSTTVARLAKSFLFEQVGAGISQRMRCARVKVRACKRELPNSLPTYGLSAQSAAFEVNCTTKIR